MEIKEKRVFHCDIGTVLSLKSLFFSSERWRRGEKLILRPVTDFLYFMSPGSILAKIEKLTSKKEKGELGILGE